MMRELTVVVVVVRTSYSTGLSLFPDDVGVVSTKNKEGGRH